MKKAVLWVMSIAMVLSMLLAPYPVQAQQAGSDEPGVIHYVGSIVFSLFYIPVKVVTCVGTHIVADTAYIATYQVPGNYDGGTNGKEIGEVARGSCTSPWVITPDQVKKDYQ